MMEKKNRRNVVIDLTQLIAWVGLMLAPSLVDLTITGDLASAFRVLKGTLHIVFPLFVLYALNYYCLVPFFLHKAGKGRWFYLSNAVIIIAWDLIRFLRPVEFPKETVDQFGEQGMWAFYVGSIFMIVFIQMLVIALAVGIRHIMRANEERVELEEERRKSAEAELTWLKNQLNPHFLFNTLNNISSLTQIDPDKAQESIGQLSDLLRYALYDSEAQAVPLASEVEFMNNYIDLMALRCNANTTVEKHLEVPQEHVEVAPLLFISLVENAFKHGVNARFPSFVKVFMGLGISGQAGNDGEKQLVFRCENSLFEKQGSDHIGSGIGLENMKRRLDLLYPGKYTYVQNAADGVYTVEVTLQLQ